MIIFILLALGFCYISFLPFKFSVQHPIATLHYVFTDGLSYIRHKGRNTCKTGELVAYVGLFGMGKTLSAVHKVCSMYRYYDGKPVWDKDRKTFVTQKVHIISNVHLYHVPYEAFVSLEQIVLAAERFRQVDIENNTRTVILVLGDEFSVQLNSRNFKSNINATFLNTLLTCRHYHLSIYYTAQRFGHVDALLRQVTSYVVSCNKLWRYQRQAIFDAWDMENATTPALIKPIGRGGFFTFDTDYDAYDTLACVGNLKKSFEDGDMMSEVEILDLQRNNPANPEALDRPSKNFIRGRKKLNK